MRALLCGLLLSVVPICHAHFSDNFYCPQNHKSGHWYTKINGTYYPDYQYPRFFQRRYLWTHFSEQNSHRFKNRQHGFYRCYNHNGYSYEFYRP